MVAHLLAHNGTADDERQGAIGVALHDHTKWMIRKGVDIAWMKYSKVHDYKQKNGWIKDHIAAMDEGWKWVMSLDDLPINIGNIGGFKGKDDKNRTMLYRAGQMFFGLNDEDSHWDMRVLLFLKWCHEHWDRFEASAEQAYQIMNFDYLYKDALELSAPLPEDDGVDDETVDYIKMEKNLLRKGTNGME